MPCLAAPLIVLPTLPFPLSLNLSLATPTLSFTFCCTFNLPVFSIDIGIPLELGMLGAGAVAAIQAFLNVVAQINAFLAKLVLNCPLD